MHRHNHSHNHSQGSSLPRGRPVLAEESALASECFEQFLTASTLKTILGSYRNICEYLHLKPNVLPLFYPKLKTHINSWKAKPLWKKFDTRANQKCYARGKATPHTRVLIIGAGPCGLRTAIEAQLLGAKVVVVEKRDRMSRNNVLHLWPFVIDDLRALGAKKFFGKFCAGSIDHISIRQLQCILLKVALLLGVEIHTEVSFEGILEPNLNEKTGWRAEFKPSDHPVSQFEFDVIIGADGKRNTLQGFKRKEFRGKLAIAITANFINKRTEAEARVEEISGVAFIFNQKFFKDLYAETGIDLENIVYYKDDTHYFVMTAKKQSLIDKGVIREDLSDTAKLLAPDNVDREELMNYAREAAEFSTNYQMPDLEFAVNHYGQPDVAMFDFTSMYAAENASRVIERHNYKLMSILVGDSLLEPFWPTGSGCARGFLSSMDAAWAIRSWGSDTATPLEVMAERESIYRLLAQTTPENLNKDYKSYTIDPSTRYPNLNKNALLPHQVTSLYDTDDPKSIELISRPAPAIVEVPKKRRRRESHVDPDTLLGWIKEQIREHEDLDVQNLTMNFKDGRVLCAIISHYRPDLLDYSAINAHDHSRNNQVAFDLLEKELGVPPVMTGEEMANSESLDYTTMLSYLTKVYDTFRCEIPHIKYPKWVQIQPRNRPSFPKEIPQILLKETTKDPANIKDVTAPDIIIKNYERKGDKTIAMQVVKFSPLTNCLSVIPKIITNMSSGIFGRYPSNKPRESCQILPVESHARVEGWIKTSNFDSDDTAISEYNMPLKASVENATKIVDNNNKADASTIAGKLKENHCKKTILNQTAVPNGVEDANNKTQNTASTMNSRESVESMTKLMETLRSSTNIKGISKTGALSSSWELYQGRTKSKSEPADQFSTIIEAEESDMPEVKRNEKVLKVRSTNAPDGAADPFAASAPPSRPSSRHKRHAVDTSGFLNKAGSTLSQDRKARKRKTLEKVGASVEDRQKRLEEIVSNRTDRHHKRRQQRKMQTEQFIKSMQMLQSNCKPDHSEPFEDYSIYLYRQTAPNFEDRVKNLEKQFIYVPDKDAKAGPAQGKREADEDFAARIKDMEEKWREPVSVEKKPKDLLRAIGKIETSDWNIKEIEKKIIENKLGKAVNKDKEKVPKWSREQFLARQTKMERQHLDRQNSGEVKFAEIDKNIKQLELKLKEGSVRDLNQHKVASITEKLVGKTEDGAASQSSPPAPVDKPVQKSNSRPVIPIQGSEYCHFCSKRVYLVERLTAEGKVFHTGCFRCQYCHTSLRLGTYTFDREGLYGHRFYCAQHFGLPGQISRPEKKPTELVEEVPQKKVAAVLGVDLLDRVQTPERIEFSNLSTGHVSSDHEESLSPIDEDEWTDRNNINSVIDTDSSDDSSSASDTDTDDEAYEEALEEPITKEGTLRWAERYKKRYSHKREDSNSDGYSSSDHSSYYENSSEGDDSDTATEGEEEIRARELRKQEVRVEPPIDAGTDTEIASCDTTSESSSEILNSATEISTDSEFAHDDPTPTREAPSRKIFDGFVTKTRGTSGHHHQQHHHQQQQPKKVQVKSSVLQQPMNGRAAARAQRDIELKFTPLVATPIVRKPAPSSLLLTRNEGYALNRTQSTGGIATKVSLELKKKYLLGEAKPAFGIQKSGSVSTLDSKFKSFHTNISDCQKLLKPAPEVSASMQAFCSKLSERTSPLSPTFGTSLYTKEKSSPNFTADGKKLELSKSISAGSVPEIIEAKVINETEGRPRSPVHEKQIIVPVIDWIKAKQKQKSDFIDSLSSDSDSDDDAGAIQKVNTITNIPRLEIHDDSGTIVQDEIAYDSLNYNNPSTRSTLNDTPKSISSEKKTLNQPKILPDLSNDAILPELHSALHTKRESLDNSTKTIDEKSSGRSSPSIVDDQATTALTETELDDFEDVEYELISDIHALHSSEERIKSRCDEKPQNITECVNILNLNIDNIEFMDTGTEETSSDDNLALKNNGYVQFRNEDDFAEDSLSPALDAIETVNPLIESKFDFDTAVNDTKVESSQTDDVLVTEVQLEESKIDNKPENAKEVCDNNEDAIETGTTTEENTCSDSTVKNVTERATTENVVTPVNPPTAETNQDDTPEFQEHCQRLQSKIEFSNVKDSLDIKRTRRKSKPDISKPDLIQEEKDKSLSVVKVEETVVTSPKLSKKEEIEKERSINQKLVQEMVMNKMRAQNKSLERKKRPRNSFSPIRPFDLAKSATTSDFIPVNKETQPLHSPTPDVLLSIIPNPLQKSQSTILTLIDTNIPLETDDKSQKNHILPDVSRTNVTPKNPLRIDNEEAKKTVEKIKQNARARCKLLSDEELGLSPEDKLIKLREMAVQKRNKDPEKIESIDVHIQDDIESLVINTDRRNSLFYSNDTLKRNTSFRRSKSGEATNNDLWKSDLKLADESKSPRPIRTKSVIEISKFSQTSVLDLNNDDTNDKVNMCKSDPNLLMPNKKQKKHHKDRERRKSITKLIAELFSKKKESSPGNAGSTTKGFLSRISPKSKNKSKEKLEDASLRRNSISEMNLRRDIDGGASPPPVPPLPMNYVRRNSLRDESSEAENEYRQEMGSSETLDHTEAHTSLSNCGSRRMSRGSRKTARQAQLKRHRMAQELQRKLEEIEVKTRDLEDRGVQVEKALRGESTGFDDNKEESDLLKEWFDLMRGRTELRRYEKELTIRAQEVELEDRHARLQHELRERLENDEPKTAEEMEIEGDIIKEMMEIVAKRDTLINLLEEDRLRYFEEDRDFEEQILAKGIHLTSLVQSTNDK